MLPADKSHFYGQPSISMQFGFWIEFCIRITEYCWFQNVPTGAVISE